MKNILSFLIIAALGVPAISSAQEHRGWAAGVKGGLLYGAAIGEEKGYYEPTNTTSYLKGGFNSLHYTSGFFAVYSDYRFNSSWALGSEVGFAVVKDPTREKYRGFFYYSHSKKDHNRPKLYIVQAIVKYYIPKAKGLHLTLGPELGINLGDRYFRYGFYVGGGPNYYRLYKYNPVTFAINSGIGYRFNFGMTLQAEYSAGLTRSISKNGEDENRELNYRDGMFRFSLSYDLFKRRK